MEKPDGCTYPNCFICPLADCSWTSAKAELPGETKKKRRIVRRSKRTLFGGDFVTRQEQAIEDFKRKRRCER